MALNTTFSTGSGVRGVCGAISEHPETRRTALTTRERNNKEKLIPEKIDPLGGESKEGFTPERHSESITHINL
jgi:hypothetical protein